MRQLYLALAIIGAVVPYIFFIDFFASEGVSLPGFLGGLFVNGAAGGFAADVFISSAVFWSYMLSNRNGPKPWLYMVINLTIGLSCALPLYLWATYPSSANAQA